jgi:hypothetical protein
VRPKKANIKEEIILNISDILFGTFSSGQ